MHISELRLVSYRRFRDSGPIGLVPGLNVIVGENDVGKTAIVLALKGGSANAPHRSLATVPERWMTPPRSEVRIRLDVSPADIRRLLAAEVGWSLKGIHTEPPEAIYARFERQITDGISVLATESPPDGLRAEIEPMHGALRLVTVTNPGAPNRFAPQLDLTGGNFPQVADILWGKHRSGVFAFNAERLNVAECPAGGNSTMQSNAGNLAEVLSVLQGTNPARYQRFVELVLMVFPHLSGVTVRPVGGNHVRILVWHEALAAQRDDCAVTLAESGTGIGQVLAMLYVAINANDPQTIIIDEPHSFLHPGALRKLFQIFTTDYSQHQYIVTTNSPAAILAVAPASVSLVERRGRECIVRAVDVGDRSDIQSFLAAVGARLSDVFGPDRILWVEGRTEEACLPRLFQAFAPQPPNGLAVLGIVNTGDLEGRDAEHVIKIYDRLTNGASLVPPAVAFVLDREGRTPEQRERLAQRCGPRLRFLPRFMYENYLLHTSDIASLLNSEDSERARDYSADDIVNWVLAHGQDVDLFARDTAASPVWSDAWLEHVNAAKLLGKMFSDLCQTRVSYADNKARFGLALTQMAIARDDAALRNLMREFVLPILA